MVERLTPLVRVLDPAQTVQHFTGSRTLAAVTSSATAAARLAGVPFRRTGGGRAGEVVRLDLFDDRADILWTRVRGDHQAMVVRDRRYLNWRYSERPDAEYTLLGFERGSDLDGYLVARSGMHAGMRWG